MWQCLYTTYIYITYENLNCSCFIFVSESGKTIEIPIIATKKPKAFKTYRGELTTLQNAEVVVKPTGKVLVKKVADLEDEEMPIEKTIKKSKHKLKGNTTKKKLK